MLQLHVKLKPENAHSNFSKQLHCKHVNPHSLTTMRKPFCPSVAQTQTKHGDPDTRSILVSVSIPFRIPFTVLYSYPDPIPFPSSVPKRDITDLCLQRSSLPRPGAEADVKGALPKSAAWPLALDISFSFGHPHYSSAHPGTRTTTY